MKKKSEYCLRCGYDPKTREKTIGCFHWGEKVANRHLYTYDTKGDYEFVQVFNKVNKAVN